MAHGWEGQRQVGEWITGLSDVARPLQSLPNMPRGPSMFSVVQETERSLEVVLAYILGHHLRGVICHSPNARRSPFCELSSTACGRSPDSLRRELSACLRTGRALRVPRARTRQRGRQFITPELMISERPAEVADRAVPGHWEGDLIIGLNRSAIGTLVERSTRFTMLLHLPPMAGHGSGVRAKNGPALAGHGAEAVRDAIATKIATLPEQMGKSLTWDQGAEMAQHAQLRIDTGLDIYFCDPRSPWQRGTNENTNGLLRQYFPKGTDLNRYGER